MEETKSCAQLYPVNRIEGLRGRGLRYGTESPIVEPKSPEPDDLELLRRASAGDAKAFHRLMDRHADRLYRLSVTLVGNAADAEDVVQETFAGAYRGSKAFEGRSSVGTWLTRILVTQAAKLRRDRKRIPELMETPEDRIGSESASVSVEKKIDLRAAMKTLSPEHQEVLTLREFEQMSYEEMAEVLGVPRGTVESRLHRARAELREKLKDYLP